MFRLLVLWCKMYSLACPVVSQSYLKISTFSEMVTTACLCFKFNISPSVCPLSLGCLMFPFLSASSVSRSISGSFPPRSLLAPHVLTTKPNSITCKEMLARIRNMPRKAYSSASHRSNEGKLAIPRPPDMVTMGTARRRFLWKQIPVTMRAVRKLQDTPIPAEGQGNTSYH